MKKWLSLFTIFSLLFSLSLFAEETKKESESTEKKSTEGADAVSNANLRASLGSMSKVSVSAGIGYVGSSIRKPLDNNTPNPNNQPGDYSTYFSGSLSARYRIDPSQSLSAGAAFVFRPDAQVNTRTGNMSKTSEFSNPYIAYSWMKKWGNVILTQGADYTKFTKKGTLDGGWHSEVGYGAGILWSGVNGTPFSLGGGISAYHDIFTDGPNSANALNGQDDYGMTPYTYVEYQINDRFNLRSVVGQGYYHYRSDALQDGWNDMVKQRMYQTVGLGVSITKVIFLYNYVKFYPKMNFFDSGATDAQSFNSTANYAFSLTMSLF
jgi:hypothetical protein